MTMCLTIKAALQSRSRIYSIIYEFISKIKRESLLGIGLFNKQSKVLIFSTLPIFCIKMLNSTPLIFNWAPTYIFKRESNSWFSFPIWKNMYKQDWNFQSISARNTLTLFALLVLLVLSIISWSQFIQSFNFSILQFFQCVSNASPMRPQYASTASPMHPQCMLNASPYVLKAFPMRPQCSPNASPMWSQRDPNASLQ